MPSTKKPAPPPDKAAEQEWVTLPEAARLLGTHRETVLKMALAGKLVADTRGRLVFISRRSVDSVMAADV